MEVYGYAGGILRIDLSTGEVEKGPLAPELAKDFIGGYNGNAKLLYENVKTGIDALSPENVIIVGAGPFVGTGLAGAAKTEWTMKSPLTGAVAAAASGGFGAPLKWAGYDYLIITGKARRPVYISILDDDIEIIDATDLWGKDIFEVSDLLWDRHGGDCTIACIGIAGENLVRISQAFVDKRSTVGRQGTGAVFGSKNLKAIVVRGTKGIRIANKDALGEKMDAIHSEYLKGPLHDRWMELGTTIALEGYPEEGSALWKNSRESFPKEKHIREYGVEAFRKVREISLPCTGCPLGCKVLVRIKEGEFVGIEVPQANNEGAVIKLGNRFNLGGYNRLIKCADFTNRTGLDNVECTSILDFILDLQEHGIISKEVTDGIVLERNFDTLYTWLNKIARREGFGSILADGWNGVFKALGEEVKKYAIQVKGSTADFDARANFGTETFGTAVAPFGGHATMALGATLVPGRTPESIRRYGMRTSTYPDPDRVFSGPCGFHVGRFAKHLETWNASLDSLGICNRPPIGRLYTLASVTELYYMVTGVKLEPQEVEAAAERGFTYLKMFNLREGFTRKVDTLPDRWLDEPLYIEGKPYYLEDYCKSKRITREDFQGLLDDYYDEWGWDRKTGIPTKEKLLSLGLKALAEGLDKL